MMMSEVEERQGPVTAAQWVRENVLLNFELKNEATRANLQENKRILTWRPFWNKAYRPTTPN